MKNKKENLKSMTDEELRKKLSELQERKRALQFKTEGAKSKNVKESKNLRKEIARVLTELNSPKRKKK